MTAGGTELPQDADRPVWARGEFAWPLAVLAGFGGSWAGQATGVPLGGPLAALLLLAPIHLAFLRLGQPGAAALLGMGGVVGAAAAVVGAVLEGGAGELSPSLPLAPWLGEEVIRLAEGDPAFDPRRAVLLRAAAFAAALATARWTRGLGPLLVALLGAGASAFGVGELARRAVEGGGSPLSSALLAWPPQGVVEFAALLFAGAALAGGGEAGRRDRRQLLLGGLGLEISALLAWAFTARAWGGWAAEALGLTAGTG